MESDYESTVEDFITTDFDWDSFDTTDSYTTTENYTIGDDLTTTDFTGVDEGMVAGILAFLGMYMVFILAIAVLMIIAVWKIFKKAGRNGWEAIIPIYNNWVLYEIVGMQGWYALLALIPFVGGIINLVFSIMANIRLAKAFGKDGGYAAGLILLPVIFYPILGFGKAEFYGVDENGNTKMGTNPMPSQPYEPNSAPQDTPQQ